MIKLKGLQKKQKAFLEENAKKKSCECCEAHGTDVSKCLNPTYITGMCGIYVGIFDDTYFLNKYELKDGTIAEEYMQKRAWSGRPVFFLGLEVVNLIIRETVRKFEWREEEIRL